MNTFQQHTFLITGENSGIGYATAKLFKAKGANVIITGRNTDAIAKVSTEMGITDYVSDQASLQAIDELVASSDSSFITGTEMIIDGGLTVNAVLN